MSNEDGHQHTYDLDPRVKGDETQHFMHKMKRRCGYAGIRLGEASHPRPAAAKRTKKVKAQKQKLPKSSTWAESSTRRPSKI